MTLDHYHLLSLEVFLNIPGGNCSKAFCLLSNSTVKSSELHLLGESSPRQILLRNDLILSS